ncbi:hypothetical protein LI99_23545 [Mycolicibacterium smegmatis]|uniref:Uncharacterized protein n=1 Tax=Mycolicibacterium smegmatis (strain ATCC 700084 / mc(2)155) TaxID=246196 RepID=A0R1H9_MYCS2|nr:hypothetical protein MSMEG_4759 [Mycolicibacterium smegmatis MC2 155]AIU16435.1 hypothetical protein LI99_23545 [Mycolicibacterium smegmatis]AIU09810.1 hypothetical protein LJ00_23540 [Mycolicibacterium smegmatis MC2 155]AIU23058.1 hypothetical protein LI98_23550 [Mycolicibacterium smegmatis]TBH50588.1 hypothetical protein EYS45_04085 [Mycolicibacterium smegmatis MC2 155]
MVLRDLVVVCGGLVGATWAPRCVRPTAIRRRILGACGAVPGGSARGGALIRVA